MATRASSCTAGRRVGLAVAAAAVFAISLVGMPVASAHYDCNFNQGITIYTDGQGHFFANAWTRLICDRTHYIYQGRVELHRKINSGNWRLLDDSGAKSDCCNIDRATFTTDADFACAGLRSGDIVRYRPRTVYIQTISQTGNVAHRHADITGSITTRQCA